MTKYIIGAFALLIIGGCIMRDAIPPAVSDIRDSMVRVYASNPYGQWGKFPTGEAVQAEADRGCSQYNKRAEPMSSYCVYDAYSRCSAMSFLFACK